ncbi:hypothetical protein [Cupriavidus necator]
MRSQVTTISLTRIEGAPSGAITRRVSSWAQADSVLRRWSESVARDGGYDKCEFAVEWENGASYQGTYDLVNWRDAEPDLAKHVRELAYLYTGRQVPRHMSSVIYGAFLDMHCTRAVAVEYEKLLAQNDIGSVDHPPARARGDEPGSNGLFRVAAFSTGCCAAVR